MKKIIAALTALTIILTIALPVSAVSKPKAPKLTSLKNTSGGVVIKWKKVSNADKYIVFRKTASTKYIKRATVKTTCFTDKKAVSGRKYIYAVKSLNSKGKSKYSKTKTLTAIGTPRLKTYNSTYAIKAKWSKIRKATNYVLLGKKAGAKKYKVFYKGTKLHYSDDNIGAGSAYMFKVKAVIGKLKGAYSPAKTQRFLESPSLKAEELLDMKGITLKWTATKKAKGYFIYRSHKYANSFKLIKKTTGSSTRFVDSNVVSITSYKYYVIAYNGSSKSAKSNIDSDVYGYFDNAKVPLTLTIKKGWVYKDIYTKLNKYGAIPFITWKSANSKVAKVNSKGVITGVKKGKATLKATIDQSFITLYKPEVKSSKTIRIIVTVK